MCQQVKKVQFLWRENNPSAEGGLGKTGFFNQKFYKANLNNLITELF